MPEGRSDFRVAEIEESTKAEKEKYEWKPSKGEEQKYSYRLAN